ncbi:MAG TPA: hypothetical protein VJY62_05325 [Bacteroidia bacterium]|nr:hypothetical protein [Bacteroidia bacterium]
MTPLIIDKKKYVIIPEKEYLLMQKKAALKSRPEKTLTVAQARAHSRKRIRQWAKEK